MALTLRRRSPLSPTFTPGGTAKTSLPFGPTIPTGTSPAAPSGPTLPTPGLSGIGWVREATPLSDVPPVAQPVRSSVPAPALGPPGDLADPSAPTTTSRLSRFRESIRDRHERVYQRLPDVGGHLPFKGKLIPLPGGRTGGVPKLPSPLLRDLVPGGPSSRLRSRLGGRLALPQVGSGRTLTNTPGSSGKELRKAVAMGRRMAKPITRLTPGRGGLDFAQGPRFTKVWDKLGQRLRTVPRGQLVDLPPPVLHGSNETPVAAPVTTSAPLANAAPASAPTYVPSAPVSHPDPALSLDAEAAMTGPAFETSGTPGWLIPAAAVIGLLIFAGGLK